MPIYELTQTEIVPIAETTFGTAGVRERDDLQRLLRKQAHVIVPNTLIIAEEFGQWNDSRRRIDLLGLDKQANLVVIELKRTEDGGHMELQAIRYAAMVSAMTFEQAVEVYASYLASIGSALDPRASLLEFLEWDEADEDRFAQDIRVVLASAEFSRELTTTVLWLNEPGLDITCVRLKPYKDGGRVLIDVQQVLPLSEAADYQVRVREKARQEKFARESDRDFTKYDLVIDGETYESMPKRTTMHRLISGLCKKGIQPHQISAVLSWRENRLLLEVDGEVDAESFVQKAVLKQRALDRSFDPKRWYCDSDDLIRCNGKTYAVINQWGQSTQRAIDALMTAFPDVGIQVSARK